MAATTITFRVDEAERNDLVARAERDKVSLSDYIRVRLGLRGQGAHDDQPDVDPQDEQAALHERIDDHERRLHALEQSSAQRQQRA